MKERLVSEWLGSTQVTILNVRVWSEGLTRERLEGERYLKNGQ
jgi:hypothetical protein